MAPCKSGTQKRPARLAEHISPLVTRCVRWIIGLLRPSSYWPRREIRARVSFQYRTSDPAVVLFEFESANGIAAEVFEAVLLYVPLQGCPSQHLAEVVDFDKPGSAEAWNHGRRNSGERLGLVGPLPYPEM
jgi:hypothetical protein